LATECDRHGAALRLNVDDLDQRVVIDAALAVRPCHLLGGKDLPGKGDLTKAIPDVGTTVLCDLLFAVRRPELLSEELVEDTCRNAHRNLSPFFFPSRLHAPAGDEPKLAAVARRQLRDV